MSQCLSPFKPAGESQRLLSSWVRPRCPEAGGGRARYLIALTGGFRRRISARQSCNRVYSAMFPGSLRSPPPAPAERCHLPVRTRPAPRGGAPAGPMGAPRRLPPPGRSPAPTRILRRSPLLSPDSSSALCKRSFSFCIYWLPTCSHYKVDQGGRWKTDKIATKSSFATPWPRETGGFSGQILSSLLLSCPHHNFHLHDP